MGAANPGRLKFRAKGDCQQNGQVAHTIDCQIKQLARGWIDPVSVLQHHQNGSFPRFGFELVEKGVEQLLSLALRAEIEIRGRTRQGKQFAEQREIFIPRAWREQRSKLTELVLGRVVAAELRGAFELTNEWMKGAVLVVRRAEMAQAHMGLVPDALGERNGEP